MDTFLYIAGTVVAVGGALVAISARHIFHAALGLAISLAGTAGLFVPLNGELIAVVQLLVYLGAVAIAIMFTLMLSPPYYLRRPKRSPLKIAAAALIAGMLSTPLFLVMMSHGPEKLPVVGDFSPIREIGRLMLSDFVFPFEIISLVLTVTIIGAIVLARDLPPEETRTQTATDSHSEPLPELRTAEEEVH
jgi:NADH:ubiquinone oxidoreductase subunit 6 (subunit J)